MANIADGYICINSKNSDLLTDLKTQIKEKPDFLAMVVQLT